MLLEQKVHARSPAGVARGPLFRPNVIELQLEEGVEEVLEVVLIFHLQGGPPVMPVKDLTCNEMEPRTDTNQIRQRVFPPPAAPLHDRPSSS